MMGGRMRVTKRSTHARRGVHTQRWSAVPTQLAGATHVLCYRRPVLCYTTCWTCLYGMLPTSMAVAGGAGDDGGGGGGEEEANQQAQSAVQSRCLHTTDT